MVDLSTQRTRHYLDALKGAHIAVIGDVMLDRYFWGSVHRVSPEAPVPVIDFDHETAHLGGAANVAMNLAGLGARPLLIGVIGTDAAGQQSARCANSLACLAIILPLARSGQPQPRRALLAITSRLPGSIMRSATTSMRTFSVRFSLPSPRAVTCAGSYWKITTRGCCQPR